MAFMVPGVKEAYSVPEGNSVNAVVLIGYSDDKEPAAKHVNEGNVAFVD